MLDFRCECCRMSFVDVVKETKKKLKKVVDKV